MYSKTQIQRHLKGGDGSLSEYILYDLVDTSVLTVNYQQLFCSGFCHLGILCPVGG